MLLRTCLLLLLCTCLCTSHSQPVIPRFETIGVNEGLSQSSVYVIYQDKFGFMWFGTADGLNRYDGSEIKVYKVNDARLNIESSYIRGNLCEDEKGNLWFANEAGIHYYDRMADHIRTIKKFDKASFGGSDFEGVFLDEKGMLWLMNVNYGIFSFSTTTHAFTEYSYPVFQDKSRIHYPFDPTFRKDSGYIWFTFFLNDGLYRFNTRSKQFEHLYPGKDCYQIFFGKGRHYILSTTQITIYDSATRSERPFQYQLNGRPITSHKVVFEDDYHRLWSCSPGEGLLCYDESSGQTFQYRHDNSKLKSLPINIVTTYCIDRNENLWVGTDGGGVSKLDLKPPKFNLFPLNEGDHPFLEDYFTKCFYEDKNGNIWFGTHNNGFNIFNPSTGKLQNFSSYQNKPLGIVGSILRDSDNNMWIGHALGLLLFDEKKKTFTEVPLHPQPRLFRWSIYVYDLKQLHNGDVIAATQWGIVHFKKKNGRYSGRTYGGVKDLGALATFVQQAPNGDIWVAASTAGLLKVQLQGDSLVVKDKLLAGINLRSVHVDEGDKNLLWVATVKGLIKLNVSSGQWTLYTEKDGMANSYVYGVLEDAKHNLWISTNGGLIYFNRASNSFQNYNVNDGLQSNEFNTGAFYKGASGNLYFGGIKGFNWFNNSNSELSRNSLKPKVAITAIYVDDKVFATDTAVLKSQTLALPHNHNNLAFSFAALDFTRPQANKIQYRLEGLDPHWITTYGKSVRYPNLAPGTYTLSVKAANSDGVWSDEEKITIFIKAPFWQSWWFYTLMGCTVLLSVIIITKAMAQRKFRKQLRELEKQGAIEAERNRISKDMHDEIGSGLTHIALMSELIQAQQKAEEELRKDVSTISQSARKLVQSMSEIIWALNPHNDTLENLLAYMREQTLDYFDPFDLEYHITFPEELPAVKLTNVQRRNLFLVAKEALHNALKHSGATMIRLHMQHEKSQLHFYVTDNGKGFDLTRSKVSSNGLRIMQRRMDDLNGFFEISSGSNGTEVHFGMPLRKTEKQFTTFFTSLRKR